MEISSEALAETYLEAAIRKWQLPAPTQCGKEFARQPPPNADAILEPPHLDVSSGRLPQLFLCNGVRNFNWRTFVPKYHLLYPFHCTTLRPMAQLQNHINYQTRWLYKTNSTSWVDVHSRMVYTTLVVSGSSCSGFTMMAFLRADTKDLVFWLIHSHR